MSGMISLKKLFFDTVPSLIYQEFYEAYKGALQYVALLECEEALEYVAILECVNNFREI